MKLLSFIGGAVVVASLAANGYFLWSGGKVPPVNVQHDQPIVVYVKGGVIGVSEIHRVETFHSTTEETILGVPVGKTVSRIRVPAVYRYHVELAPEWKVLLKDKTFIVVSPPVKASLPVAIDTGKLEAESSGTWSIFVGGGRRDELLRSITRNLAVQAVAPSQLLLQREVARQTLKDFVGKWLITQEQWKGASTYPVRVFFADEPIQSLSTFGLAL